MGQKQFGLGYKQTLCNPILMAEIELIHNKIQIMTNKIGSWPAEFSRAGKDEFWDNY